MRKVFMTLAVLFCLTGTAFADIRVEMTRYKCTDCGKEFFTFRGDADLDGKKFDDPKYQLSHVFQLENRSRNLENCKRSSKAHHFKKNGTRSFELSDLSRNLQKVIAIKDGPSMNLKLQEWTCKYCNKKFYSLGSENLNIRQWDRQPDYIYTLKGRRSIFKCNSKDHPGHVFDKKSSRNAKSWEIANLLENIYYVR